MLEYLALCCVCIILLSIVLHDELGSMDNLPIMTQVTVAALAFPLIPIAVFLFLILKVIRK